MFYVRLFSILALVLLLPTTVALAQSAPTFASVEVDLWPEFDRPSMLVIYRISLSSDVRLPVELSLRIPGSAGSPNAVAVKQPDGSLINLPYNQQDVGNGWSGLTFSATGLDLQIEYYDPGLTKNGTARSFIYRWSGDYAVSALTIEVQQPVGAMNMKISPSLGAGVAASDGLVYFSQLVGALTQGQSFEITLEYDKANDDLSAGSMSVSPGGSLDQTASGRLTLTSALPWILGFVGLMLIVGGGVWYWRAGKQSGTSRSLRTQNRPRPRGPTKNDEAGLQDGGNVYCHQCGKRAAAGDRFCRACGTQLRIS